MPSVDRIVAAARAVIDGRPPVPRRATAGLPDKPALSLPSGNGQKEKGDILLFPQDRHEPPTARQEKVECPPFPTGTTSGVPVLMPNMDLIITEATVVAWLKQVGDTVRKGEALLEIETDKAVTEVESPADGVLVEILADEGTGGPARPTTGNHSASPSVHARLTSTVTSRNQRLRHRSKKPLTLRKRGTRS